MSALIDRGSILERVKVWLRYVFAGDSPPLLTSIGPCYKFAHVEESFPRREVIKVLYMDPAAGVH